jgi:hypothetical protein
LHLGLGQGLTVEAHHELARLARGHQIQGLGIDGHGLCRRCYPAGRRYPQQGWLIALAAVNQGIGGAGKKGLGLACRVVAEARGISLAAQLLRAAGCLLGQRGRGQKFVQRTRRSLAQVVVELAKKQLGLAAIVSSQT